jgi:hypothetical protein
MARDGSFFVFSFGFARDFTLQKGNAKPPHLAKKDIVWQEALRSGSLLKVSAKDNRTYYHALHKAQGAGERWSLIFRVIKSFIPIDHAVAAEVNDRMYRFVSKKQVEAGARRPGRSELDSFARSQSSFTTAPERREMRRHAEEGSGSE